MTAEHYKHRIRHSRRRGSEIAPYRHGAFDLRINPDSYVLLEKDLVWVDIRPHIPEYERIIPGSKVRYNEALVRTVNDVSPHETLEAMLTPDILPLFDGYGFTREELIQAIQTLKMRQDKGFLLFIHERL